MTETGGSLVLVNVEGYLTMAIAEYHYLPPMTEKEAYIFVFTHSQIISNCTCIYP